ncbi:MAG: hypothetical protein M1821_001020 [Bathelium mastoideum]|nr:MAG: hypothetical protein M1821_001020 [Bathelium mastoideum]
MQEDLAGLFSRNLTLSAPPPPSQASPFQPPPQQSSSPTPEQPPSYAAQPMTISLADVQRQPIIYASTHYTHSAHAAGAPRAHSEPRTPNPTDTSVAVFDTLTRNSIDPQSLTPSQLHLYANADADQKLRLLELWRISPPSHSASGSSRDIEGADAIWYGTSVHQEEQLARLRYERLMEERRMLGHAHRPEAQMGPGRAGGYELSGYEQLAQREYDGSFAAGAGNAMPLQDRTKSWNRTADSAGWFGMGAMPEKTTAAEDMENQYGMWAEVREVPPAGHGGGRVGVDDEMMM